MEKTTVYLSSEQKAALARAAQAQGRSEARLIRAGIDAVTARHRSAEAGAALVEDELESIVPPSQARPRWVGRDAFLDLIQRSAADARLRDELRELSPGTTDDEPIP